MKTKEQLQDEYDAVKAEIVSMSTQIKNLRIAMKPLQEKQGKLHDALLITQSSQARRMFEAAENAAEVLAD